MEKNFFQYICTPPGEEGNYTNETSMVGPLFSCDCLGTDFSGMPTLSFLLQINDYDIDFFYELEPLYYELFPKVNSVMK